MMNSRVLILGGYGNFGKRIAAALVAKDIPVLIAGRNLQKAEAMAASLGDKARPVSLDAEMALEGQLSVLKPTVVINTVGPFQGASYQIAESCIAQGVHYVDLADGRDFVSGITALDDAAKAAGVVVISGASTVPGLSSAVVEHFKSEFSEIELMRFGISPGQQAERGLATTQGVLSYVGKPLSPYASIKAQTYGWQDIYQQDYPVIGKRWMANCEVPDLDLLPARYGIRQIQFSAGLELWPLHLGLNATSWLIRAGIPLDLSTFAKPLLAISNWLNGLGSPDGGMHIILKGKGRDGAPHTRRWFIIAKDGDGPHIPTIPAIVLAERLAKGEAMPVGAHPCVGLVALEEYLSELRNYTIQLQSARL